MAIGARAYRRSLAWFTRLRERLTLGDVAPFAVLGLMILAYIWTYTVTSIHFYTIGLTYFDLAVFDQSFWNALRGTLFFNSLEGDISHFGRHFSPILYFLLPFYAVHPHPATLLTLQSIALGLAAAPLFLVARRRLGSSWFALTIAAAYLASPAVHDIDLVNEFHEVSFAIPILFTAFYAADTQRWRLYGILVLLALMVKEDIALAVAALGLYVAFIERQRAIGLATVAGAVVWFVTVIELVMPALRGPLGAVPFHGYEYLGDGIFGIAGGIITQPGTLWDVMTSDPKLEYLKWLLLPVGFLGLLAPHVLLIGLPSMLIILASTHPPTYVIFERYVAPSLPFVFLASVVGVGFVRRFAEWSAARWISGEARIIRRAGIGALALCSVLIIAGTVYTQSQLGKHPEGLWYSDRPSPNAAAAMEMAGAVPAHASVTIEDHRLLARASQRRELYYLAGPDSLREYVLVNHRVSPVTHQPEDLRREAIAEVIDSGDYLPARCAEGAALYVQADAYARDDDLFGSYDWRHDRTFVIDDRLRLTGYDIEPPNPPVDTQLRFTLFWQSIAEQELDGSGLSVVITVLDEAGAVVGEQRDWMRNSCATALWPTGIHVPGWHGIVLPPELGAGDYRIEIQVMEGDELIGDTLGIDYSVEP